METRNRGERRELKGPHGNQARAAEMGGEDQAEERKKKPARCVKHEHVRRPDK